MFAISSKISSRLGPRVPIEYLLARKKIVLNNVCKIHDWNLMIFKRYLIWSITALNFRGSKFRDTFLLEHAPLKFNSRFFQIMSRNLRKFHIIVSFLKIAKHWSLVHLSLICQLFGTSRKNVLSYSICSFNLLLMFSYCSLASSISIRVSARTRSIYALRLSCSVIRVAATFCTKDRWFGCFTITAVLLWFFLLAIFALFCRCAEFKTTWCPLAEGRAGEWGRLIVAWSLDKDRSSLEFSLRLSCIWHTSPSVEGSRGVRWAVLSIASLEIWWCYATLFAVDLKWQMQLMELRTFGLPEEIAIFVPKQLQYLCQNICIATKQLQYLCQNICNVTKQLQYLSKYLYCNWATTILVSKYFYCN